MPARHEHGGDRCRGLLRDRINAAIAAGQPDDVAIRLALRECRREGCNVRAPRPYKRRPAMPARKDAGWFNG